MVREGNIDTQTQATPDAVLASGDPGDETARRYRYQWTWAAIGCCMLLDATSDVVELFCEHHEDVLLRRVDGRFIGLQIKTRDETLEPWRTGDESVKNALARFCKLEAAFPSQFGSFCFLTNHVLHAAGNGQDLCHVLQQIRSAADLTDLAQSTRRYLGVISRLAGCTESVAFIALSKTTADDGLPKLADIETRLVDTLSENWSRASELTYPALRRAARRLVQECTLASSLGHEDILPAYVPALPDSVDVSIERRIAGKRFNVQRLLATLEEGVNETEPLHDDPASLVQPGTGDGDLLLKKLDAGGFSVISRNSAVDLRGKAEYLALTWTKKHGHSGLQRYSHVRSLVLSDAAAAFEATRSQGDPFGVAMLAELRERMQQRKASGDLLYECSTSHLEGFAYSLTAECQVQWSLDRPWEAE